MYQEMTTGTWFGRYLSYLSQWCHNVNSLENDLSQWLYWNFQKRWRRNRSSECIFKFGHTVEQGKSWKNHS